MKSNPWLLHPWLSTLLGLSWLLLQHSIEPVHLLSAALIGLFLPRIAQNFLPKPTARIRIQPALRLTRLVLWDIIISNIAVAKLVLGSNDRLRPGWIDVPLSLTHPTAISLFATIITNTPGTVSCAIDEDRRVILVHALDCADAAQMATDMKERYEVLLMAIFEPLPVTAGASS